MSRLTAKTLAEWRVQQDIEQGHRCALCRGTFSADNPGVGDHDHTTGAMRGLLHRGCNAMLGHLENNRARNKLKDPVQFARFLQNVGMYLSKNYAGQPLYPTFRNEEEKRDLRNKRARAKRAKTKDTA